MKKWSVASAVLLVFFVCWSGCVVPSPPGKLDSRLCRRWEKTDDPSTVLEFTTGGHLIVTADSNTYSTTYSIVGSEIVIYVTGLGVSRDHSIPQRFSREILPSGELLLVCSKGPHRDEAIIKRLEGRYTPLQPLNNNATQASGRLDDRLAEIRQKDKDTVSRLAGFRKGP